ncbi:hypothetical protein DWY36_01090 [Firmicutes bacterium AF25-13AC]|nr:hypothetical protein DWY36_01090 [Firmicutes bacterium AF25-13AC]
MENQFYQMYLDELSEIPECTNEEMEALLNSLPNEEAVKRLTEGSLAYVVREAAKYAGNDVEISDLVQEGNMALLLVLKNYASHPVVGDDAVPILISFVSAQFIWQWKQLQKSKNKVSRQQKN